jgi:PKD repeat protein
MKNLFRVSLIMLLFIFQQSQLFAQKDPFCGSDYLRKRLQQQDSSLKAKEKQIDLLLRKVIEKKIASKNPAGKNSALTGIIYTIPVVVHIVHNGGPENISDAQVQTAIANFNDAFRNRGVYDPANGADIEIEFCLAKKDPVGNFTTGINRITNAALTNMTIETDDANLKGLIDWDPTKYLNFWLVNSVTSSVSGSGVAAYSTLAPSHGTPLDGIVGEASYFGSSTDNSKVFVHELGHYFNLLHTFEGGCTNNDCMNDGDKVCDTPPDNNSAGTCVIMNTCATDIDDPSANNPFRPVGAGGLGDQTDMISDYMDYSAQSCQNSFTEGQKTRMRAALENVRTSLLSSDGCQSGCVAIITASFTPSATTVNSGTSVTFTNTSTGTANYTWQENGVPFSNAISPFRSFTTPGIYHIKLIADNGSPECIKETTQDITVICPVVASFTSSTTNPTVGSTVTFNNTSTGATSYQWLVDGVPAAATPNFSYTFTGTGGFSFQLIASSTTCSDASSTVFMNIASACANAKDGNIWYFGFNAGLDFNSGSPVMKTDGALHTLEGCATISDKNGSLLFYTDGVSVYNKNHIVMSNGSGLLGHKSSSQAALIIPFPGDCKKYYIFTSDASENSNANGVRYSVVDMNIGLTGDVTATKNVLLNTPSTEKLTATYHSNGIDIWVVTHALNTNAFLAYRVTPAGVNPAVVSNIGGAPDYPYGAIKLSKSGKKLASCLVTSFRRDLEVFDFNNATGAVTNQLTFPLGINPNNGINYQPSGVEFSPDNSKVYVNSINGGMLDQFDLTAGSQADIMNSRFFVSNTNCMGLLMGPDGKIYVNTVTNVGTIGSPNTAGAGCNFTSSVISFLDLTGQCLNNFLPVCNSCCPVATVTMPDCPSGTTGTAYLLGDYTYKITVTNTNNIATT